MKIHKWRRPFLIAMTRSWLFTERLCLRIKVWGDDVNKVLFGQKSTTKEDGIYVMKMLCHIHMLPWIHSASIHLHKFYIELIPMCFRMNFICAMFLNIYMIYDATLPSCLTSPYPRNPSSSDGKKKRIFFTWSYNLFDEYV